MKTNLVSVIGLAMALVLGGCVSLPTQEEAAIQRYVSSPVEKIEAAVRKTALARGFTETARNVYEQPASYPVDPIVGLVKTSDTPNSYLRISVEFTENASGTLVKAAPCTVAVSGKGKPFYWRPGTQANALAVAIVESAVAEAQFLKGAQ